MGERRKIGLLFDFDHQWTGGLYYLSNIIGALNLLSEKDKPQITIFYLKSESISELNIVYPFINYLPIHKKLYWIHKVVRKVAPGVFSKYLYPQYSRQIVDFIYPCNSLAFLHKSSLREIAKIFWIPDFQHKRLPDFFTPREIAYRDKAFEQLATSNLSIVLSSKDALGDFLNYYPKHNATLKVLSFTSVLPEFKHINIECLRDKYFIRNRYFMAPNQFWAHKNHIIIIKAAQLLKNEGFSFQIIFSGREKDYRNPHYVDNLKKYVDVNDLTDCVSFLGFIDRLEQLKLMQGAIAIIQPSLFEGWSTVVEDAKAVNQTIILSNLNVHAEQCSKDATYFNPEDEHELAEIMKRALAGMLPDYSKDYSDKLTGFANDILNLSN